MRSSRTLTANIRRRRKSKVAINLPIFIDDRTPRPFVDPTIPWQRNVFPEDAGGVPSIAPADEDDLIIPSRGEKRCSTYRSHLHGRDGLRHGMLLSASDLPMLQHRPSAPHVRRSHPNRTHNGMRVFTHLFCLSFLMPFIARVDGCKPALAGLHRRCGLPVERNCRERGRSYRRGARPQGKGLPVVMTSVVRLTEYGRLAPQRKSNADPQVSL
jgi:hypothetical protein